LQESGNLASENFNILDINCTQCTVSSPYRTGHQLLNLSLQISLKNWFFFTFRHFLALKLKGLGNEAEFKYVDKNG
jgi:hypothetical protein